MTSRSNLTCAALVALLLVACASCLPAGDPIVIVSPEEGAAVKVTTFKAEVKVPVSAGSIAVSVNDKAVAATEYKVTTEGETTVVSGSPAASRFLVGTNKLTVSAKDASGGSHTKSVAFKFLGAEGGDGSLPKPDTTEPVVSIASPVKGKFYGVGTSFTVAGTVKDASKIVKLVAYLDGDAHDKTASLGATGFTFPVTVAKGGLHSVKIEATDSFGNVGRSKVSFFGGVAKPSGSLIPNAIGVGISKAGFDTVASLLEDELTASKGDLKSRLTAINPIWSGSALFVKAEMSVTDATYGAVDLSLVPTTGGAYIKADLYDLWVGLKVKVTMGFTFYISGSIKASVARFSGKALASKTADSKLVFSIPDATVSLEGFVWDIKGFPGALERAASGFVEPWVEGKITGMIKEKAAPMLARELGALALDKSMAVLGHSLRVAGGLDTVSFKPEGADISLGMLVEAADAPPGPDPLGGFLYTANPPVVPSHLSLAPFALAMSDDVPNAALYQLWRIGALSEIEFVEKLELKGIAETLTVALLDAYFGPDFSKKAGIGRDTAIKMVFGAGLPPIVHLGGSKGMGSVSIHDLKFTVYAGTKKLFTLEIDVTAPIDISVTAESKIRTKFYPTETKFDVRILYSLVGLERKIFEPLITDLMPHLMPILLKSLHDFPLPTLASFGMKDVTLDAHDGAYFMIHGGLVRK